MRPLDSLTRAEKNLIAVGAVGEVAGLPAFVYTDGPNGVRGAIGSTAFPSSLVLGASFDVELAAEYGRMLATEVLAAGRNVLLGPVGDVLRVPWNGRAGESFGEDPVLVGEMAGRIGQAVQAHGVLAIAKHFVANNFEHRRTGSGPFVGRTDGVDVVISERALREVYLEPFRRMIAVYGVAGLMTSYNRLRGEYLSQTRAMLELPRREWGFEGATFPDYLFAVRDPQAALDAGLDIPGLDGPSGREAAAVEMLSADRIDELVGHVLSSIASVSLADATAHPERLGSPAARDLSERMVREGAVLLKNDAILPVARGARVLLVAPHDLSAMAITGGSAGVDWPEGRIESLADALRRNGFDVVDVDPGAADVPLPTVTSESLRSDAVVSVRDVATGAVRELALSEVELYDRPDGIGPEWSAELTATVVPRGPGRFRFALDFAGDAELTIDGESVVASREASPMIAGPAYPLQAFVDSAGGPIGISLRFSTAAALDVPPLGLRPGFRLGWSEVTEPFDRARHAAADADIAVVVVGRASGEAMDLESLRLPAAQEALIETIAAANPATLVVTMGSGPVVMPWIEQVPAVLHLGQAGEGSAPALADLVAGVHEPGGRLPYTVPRFESDVPLERDGYPGADGRAVYSEGLEVGYRGYRARGIRPLFEFGHGLGYTEFALDEAEIATDQHGIELTATVRNTGARAGKAVLQLYVDSLDGDSPRAMRAFAVVRASASDSARAVITVAWDDLREFDESAGSRLPRRFGLDLGLSSSTTIWSREVERP